MDSKSYIVIASIIILSVILLSTSSAYAEHGVKPVGSSPYEGFNIDDHDVVSPQINEGHGHFHSLKEQVNSGLSNEEIICPNSNQVLVERPNGKLACVYVTTTEKLGW